VSLLKWTMDMQGFRETEPGHGQHRLCTPNMHFMNCMLPTQAYQIGHAAQHNELFMERGMQLGKRLSKNRPTDPEQLVANNLLLKHGVLGKFLGSNAGQTVPADDIRGSLPDTNSRHSPLQMLGSGCVFSFSDTNNRGLLQRIRRMLGRSAEEPSVSAWKRLVTERDFDASLLHADKFKRATLANGHVVTSSGYAR
jgi:hypothetical protein